MVFRLPVSAASGDLVVLFFSIERSPLRHYTPVRVLAPSDILERILFLVCQQHTRPEGFLDSFGPVKKLTSI
jgi:hypothetical protein